MVSGRLKWFNETKGFGFIEYTQGQDIFLHYSALKNANEVNQLLEGAQVEFDLVDTESGPQAQNVKLLSLNEVTG